MRTLSFLFSVVLFFGLAGPSRAGNIIGISYSLGDTNLACYPSITWTGSDGDLNMGYDAKQYGSSVMSGKVTAADAGDPSITIGGSVENDFSYGWTGYKITIFMDRIFTIGNVSGGPSNPNDWVIDPPTVAPGGSPTYYPGGQYYTVINYHGTTLLNPGEDFDFGYKLTFVGSTTYGFTQEMTPFPSTVPEPGSVALAGFGLAAFLALKRRSSLTA